MKKIENQHGSIIISGGEDHEDISVDFESLYDEEPPVIENGEDFSIEPLEIYLKLDSNIELFGKLIFLKLEKTYIKVKYEVNNNQNQLLLQLNNLLSKQVFLKEIKLQQSTIKPENFVFKSFTLRPNQENQQYSCCSLVFG